MASELLKEWTTKVGLPAQIRQGYAKCGYVGVPQGHPAHGKHCDHVSVDVHGGLTYSGDPDKDGMWWLGFDTMHGFETKHHRSDEYMTDEIEELASQLAAMAPQSAGQEPKR